MLQQCAKSGRDTLELIAFELTDHNPAPVFPAWTLHTLISSLRGAAELQHRKGLGLQRKKEFCFKADPLSKRRIFLNPCLTFAKFCSHWGQGLEELDHLRLLLYTSAAAQDRPTNFTHHRWQSCFFLSVCKQLNSSNFSPMQTERDLESWCSPWDVRSAPKSKKPAMGVLSWVFMVPSGYKLDRDIAAVLSDYKELGSRIACPEFTDTTTCKKEKKKRKKKQAHQKFTDPEWSIHCSGGAKPWYGPFIVMQGEFWALPYWEIKSFCVVSKIHSCLSGFVKEQRQWLGGFASLIHAWLTDCTPCSWTSNISLLESLKSLMICMRREIGFEISSKSCFGQSDTKCCT